MENFKPRGSLRGDVSLESIHFSIRAQLINYYFFSFMRASKRKRLSSENLSRFNILKIRKQVF